MEKIPSPLNAEIHIDHEFCEKMRHLYVEYLKKLHTIVPNSVRTKWLDIHPDNVNFLFVPMITYKNGDIDFGGYYYTCDEHYIDDVIDYLTNGEL